jgi:hypothetical protein
MNVASLPPGNTQWRVIVATLAQNFFAMQQDATIAETLGRPHVPGQPYSPFNTMQFIQYLSNHAESAELREKIQAGQRAIEIQQLLTDMERAGLLLNCGRDLSSNRNLFNTAYWGLGRVAKSQISGFLWLSEAVGPGLVIETYGAVTAPVARPGEPGIGSGLVLDQWHILTNKHVVEDLHIGPGDELGGRRSCGVARIATSAAKTRRTQRALARGRSRNALFHNIFDSDGCHGTRQPSGTCFEIPLATPRSRFVP